MMRASSWEKVIELSESFWWARWRRLSGKPSASPQRKINSRTPRSRNSASHLARAFESRFFAAAGLAQHQKPNFHNGLVSPEERSHVASLLGMTILVGRSLQPVFLAFFEEGFAADAEGFSGAADLVMRRFERGGDDLTLHF